MTRATSCPRTEELAGILLAEAGDERRAHIESCPRCRAQVAELRAFMEPGELEGARVAEADAHLAAALHREMRDAHVTHAAPVAPRAIAAPRPSFWASLFAPALRPAWGMAAVLVVAGGLWMTLAPRPNESVVRGGADAVVETLAPAVEGGTLTLAWKPVAGATGYDVTFLSADLAELGSPVRVTEPKLVLGRDALPAGVSSGASVMWQVTARSGERELVHSVTQGVTLP